MRTWVTTAAAVLLLLAAVPTTLAEFGPESEDGWPIDVDGNAETPPVEPRPAHAVEAGEPLNKAGPVTVYPYYPLLTAEVQRLADENPDLVKLTSAGQSLAGLDLWLLEIANFAEIETGEGIPLDERETLYIDGGTHSNEYSAVYFVTEIAQFLLDEYDTNETAEWIVDNRHTWILPLVNPDGSNAFGRLNANTVNINRNFPAIWGEVDESPIMNNPGPEPASEPETQVVLDVLEEVQPDYVNSIHCCGNLWLYPYGQEGFQTEQDDNRSFSRICDEVFYDVREDCGPIWSTIYPASGTTADTGYDLHGASSWTYEMSGRGAIAPWGQPAIADDVRVQERESWRGIIHAFLNVEKYGAHPVLTELTGQDDALTATVENTGYQPLRNGTLTVDDTTVELPDIGAGNTTEITLEGGFEPGTANIELVYQKRVKHAPMGTTQLAADLVEDGDQLVADLVPTASDEVISSTSTEEQGVPGPGLWASLALVAAALVATRRWRD